MKTKKSKTKYKRINTHCLILNALFFLFLTYTEKHLITKININLGVSASKIKLSNLSKSEKINLKSNLNFKFSENCANLLTCEACLKNSDQCGWCYTDGLCKSGNLIGASAAYSFCPFNAWTTKKCQAQPCKNYENQLACITDENCFWCENTLKENNVNNISTVNFTNDYQSIFGTCEESEIKYNKLCLNKYDVNDYFKNPKFFKGKNTNSLLNNDIKQFSNIEIHNELDKRYNFNIQNNLIINQGNNKSSKQEEFLSNLKNFTKVNSLKNPLLYNSISNPAGIFEYQRKLLNKNNLEKTGKPFNLENEFTPNKPVHLGLRRVDSTLSDTLLEDSWKETSAITKKIAFEHLVGMFEFSEAPQHIKKSEEIFDIKEYKILEQLAAEKWVEFLEKKRMKLSDLRLMIGFNRDEPESRVDVYKIVEKHQRLSHLYILKINEEQIDALHSFKTHKWSKIPGTSLGFNAYFNSILIVFQKIRLEGKGSNFESLAVSNDEGIKSLMNFSHKKNLTKIDLNNFVARKVKKGENKFYLAYRSNFEIAPSDENTILNYALEFPFTHNLEISQEKFIPPALTNDSLSKTILKYDLKVTLPKSQLEESLLKQNYLFIYKLSSNYLEKSCFVKLNIKKEEKLDHLEDMLASHNVHLPFLAEIKNIFGLAAVKLVKGNYEISAEFKYISQHSMFDNVLNDDIGNEKFNKLNSSTTIKLNKFDEQKKYNSTKTKSGALKDPKNPENPEHSIKTPLNNLKKKKLKKKKKKKKKKHNNTNIPLRDGEDFEEDFDEEEDSLDEFQFMDDNSILNKAAKKEKEVISAINNLRGNNSIHNKTAIKFSKNKYQTIASDDSTNNAVEEKIETLKFQKFDNEFLLNKIKELSLKLEKSEQLESNKIIKQPILNTANNNDRFKINSEESSKEIKFIQINEESIESEESEETEEDEFEREEDDESETDSRFLENLNEHGNQTKAKKGKKHNKKHKNKKKNFTMISNLTKLVEKITNNEALYYSNKTINHGKDIKSNKTDSISYSKLELISQQTYKKANVSSTAHHKKKSKKHKGKHHGGKTNHSIENPKKNYSLTQPKNNSLINQKEKIKNETTPQQIGKNPSNETKTDPNPDINSTSNLTFYPKSDDASTSKIMQNLHQVLKNIKNETDDSHQHFKNEFFDLNLIRLPMSTRIYNKIHKNFLYFQPNNELNEIPSLAFNFKLRRKKNVLIFLNAIMTLDYTADFEFRLLLNGEDECNCAIISKSKQLINESSIHLKKLPVGHYKIEALYKTNKQGEVNLGKHEWDVLSLTLIAFDV